MKSLIHAKVSLTINAPKARVWDALTKPEMVKQYFFGTELHTDWKVGNPIRFTGEYEGKAYEDKGKILAFEEGKLIKYNYWSSMSGTEDKPENYADITYELSGDEKKSIVTITQEDVKDEKTKEHSDANWKTVLEGMKKLVEK